jgi:hypothetical protein
MEGEAHVGNKDADSSSQRTTALLLFFGILLASSEMLYRLLIGKDIVDSVWPHAVRSLEWTLALRSSMEMTLTVFLLMGILGWSMASSRKKGPLKPWATSTIDYSLGVLIGFISLHLLLDTFYLRGAFLLLPTLMGWMLICLLVGRWGAPTWRRLDGPAIAPSRVLHLLGVFFAAWMLMPGIPALAGFAPSPPDAPVFGYGSSPGPFTTTQYQFPYEMPEEVASVQGVLEDDVVFSVYITLPDIPEDLPVSTLPLAVLLHGFGYPDVNAYTAWIDHLAAKGMAVAFIQYPSDLRPSGYESFEAEDRNGMSDYLQHTYRDVALAAAMDHLDSVLLGPQRDDAIDGHLGNLTVDPHTLWAGGHSLGAAYTFLTLDNALARGWGQHALVVALEAPASRPMQSDLQPNLEGLPEHTLVQIGVMQDDMSVGMCPGAFHQQMFNALPQERNQLIEVQTDKYGFPRLVASHYLQTDPVRDALSDWSFYRRIDAQADFLVAHSRNDTFTSDWAYQYMTDETMLTGMGSWSDGTPVLPLRLHFNAIEDVEPFQTCV